MHGASPADTAVHATVLAQLEEAEGNMEETVRLLRIVADTGCDPLAVLAAIRVAQKQAAGDQDEFGRLVEPLLPRIPDGKLRMALSAVVGFQRFQRGEYELAFDLLNGLTSPRDPAIEMVLGLCCRQLGRADAALSHFRAASDDSGDTGFVALLAVAMLNVEAGDLQHARATLAEAASREHCDAPVFRVLVEMVAYETGDTSALVRLRAVASSEHAEARDAAREWLAALEAGPATS